MFYCTHFVGNSSDNALLALSSMFNLTSNYISTLFDSANFSQSDIMSLSIINQTTSRRRRQIAEILIICGEILVEVTIEIVVSEIVKKCLGKSLT